MRDLAMMAVVPAEGAWTRLAAAACAADALGVLDLVGAVEPADSVRALAELRHVGPAERVGLRIAPDDPAGLAVARDVLDGDGVVVLAPGPPDLTARAVTELRPGTRRLVVEVLSSAEGRRAEDLGADEVVAVGNEAGGEVSPQTSMVLLQALLRDTGVPVWVRGGVGLHSAAAHHVLGATGLVLDVQLVLMAESPLPDHVRRIVARSDGGDTRCLGDPGRPTRVHVLPGTAPSDERGRLRDALSWTGRPGTVLPLGQDAAAAVELARRYGTTGAAITALRRAAHEHAGAAHEQAVLAAGSPLARAHGCRLPFAQGPMTRVSDTPEFVAAVARSGALPFLALGLADGAATEELVRRTGELLGGSPWGVGILGFVDEALRREQATALLACPPPYALVAGGRPDQAAALERAGVRTYLHVPSPTLLDLFVHAGARRFVLEGNECGGHVGPRSSAVLWDQAVRVLLDLPGSQLAECDVLLAGGIHDGASAAAAAAVVAPLVARGARAGILMGTAYALTDEAVATGAVTETFREVGLACDRTVLLETGPGHASRCAATPFAEEFRRERERLLEEGADRDAVREELEGLNLGRLRVASKGLLRLDGAAPVRVEAGAQRTEGMYMLGDVATLCDRRRSLEVLHGEIRRGSRRALERAAVRGAPPTATRTDVAIIGMACLMPGTADLASFWDDVVDGVDQIREVPAHRWRTADYFDPDPAAPDRIYSRWGGFIDPVAIDPVRFGIPPASVPSIEPVQLLALHCAEQALADAGLLDRDFPRERTAVVFGIGGGIADLGQRYAVRSGLPMYVDRHLNGAAADVAAQLPGWTEDSFAGILLNVVPGRIANRLDLHGVNLAVDAACASSLAALQVGIRELEQGTSDVVLVGGADTVQNPFGYLCFSKTRALSPRGRCRSFDAAADGIVISEGVAVVVLRRLDDAVRDGDRVYAVVKGVGSSSDGRGLSLTAPRTDGQALALERAYAVADVPPRTVGLLEAHGTGTVAGDRTELAALAAVFGADGAAPGACALGSVKSLVGHTKCAAGIAGLVKVAMALNQQVLPPTAPVETPHPALVEPGFPFFLNTEARPWVRTGPAPRRAAVSSFGFGGVNVHAVLEEHDVAADHPARPARWPEELVLLAAGSAPELQARVRDLAGRARACARPGLTRLADEVDRQTATEVRADGRPLVRCAVLAGSGEDLARVLGQVESALDGDVRRGWAHPRGTAFLGVAPPRPEGEVAFLFPGQGSQYPGMLRDLGVRLPQARRRVERAERVLRGRLDRPLSRYLWPPPGFSEDAAASDLRELTRTEVAQPALGAVSLALADLLAECGVRPAALAGHSYGEYVALALSGALEEDELFRLSYERGRCLRDAAADAPGGMLAVAAPLDELAGALGGLAGVTAANLNSPRQTVLAGTDADLREAERRLTASGVSARALPVACAFHSPLVRGAAETFAAVLEQADLRPPQLPVYANVTGAPYPTSVGAVRDLLLRQLVSPVRFLDQVEAMHGSGSRVFVEVGPRSVLSGLVGQILADREHRVVATDVPGRAGTSAFAAALARLFVAGVPVDPAPLFRCRVRPAEPQPSRTAWLVDGGRSLPPAPSTTPTGKVVTR